MLEDSSHTSFSLFLVGTHSLTKLFKVKQSRDSGVSAIMRMYMKGQRKEYYLSVLGCVQAMDSVLLCPCRFRESLYLELL